ncbi:hypothetical protein FRC07_005583, partial [Ceratobasidium sp. 392]
TVEPGDYYSEVKGSDLADLNCKLEEIDHIEDIIDPKLNAGSDSDDDDALFRLGLAPDTAQEDTEDNGQTKNNTIKKNPWLETLNVVQKVHEIVVYVTASPKQPKEFHQTIRLTCSKDKIHLFVIQSMQMRWGSAYLEGKQALELCPVNAAQPFCTATEAMLRKDMATLADVFPTFASGKSGSIITTL